MHVRAGQTEGLDRPRDGRGEGRRGGEAHLEFAQLAALGAAGDGHRPLQLGQHLTRLGQEQPAGLAQRHSAVGALEQAHAQLLLQRLDLLAQRRLGNAQLQGGAAEVQLFGNGDEIAQVAEFHDASIES
ncbi:hypothetical protein D3C81_1176640 [compost metagenome]